MVLSKELITAPSQWRLALTLRADGVEVEMQPAVAGEEPIRRNIPLDASKAPLAAFEDLIYENPLLLSEFEHVSVLIDTPRFMVVPGEIADDADALEALLEALWPGQGLVAHCQPIAGTNEALLMGVDEGLLAFIGRTFLDSTVAHPMRLFAEEAKEVEDVKEVERPRSTVFVERPRSTSLSTRQVGDTLYIVAYDDDKLVMANAFHAPTEGDAAYFKAAAQALLNSRLSI